MYRASSRAICTFATTGTDFVEQHWYLCYTCGLTGSTGACSVCVQTCHAGHDVVYGTKSRFFCDCGGGEGLTLCKALDPVEYVCVCVWGGGIVCGCVRRHIYVYC